MTNQNIQTDHYVSRPEGRVYYAKSGSGEPLLLLHPVGISGWSWRKVINDFSQHYTCYNIDLPGYGHSDVPKHQFSVDDYTQAILDVMDNASIKQTHILGSHTGAMISVIIAARHPRRVKKMVLDGIPYWNKNEGEVYFEEHISKGFTDTTSFDRPTFGKTNWDEESARNPALSYERWEKGEEINRKSRYWSRLTFESICSFDMTSIGPSVQSPSLILNGDGERIRFSENQAEKGIAGTKLKVIEKSPGPVHEYQPVQFTKLALDFLLGN